MAVLKSFQFKGKAYKINVAASVNLYYTREFNEDLNIFWEKMQTLRKMEEDERNKVMKEDRYYINTTQQLAYILMKYGKNENLVCDDFVSFLDNFNLMDFYEITQRAVESYMLSMQTEKKEKKVNYKHSKKTKGH